MTYISTMTQEDKNLLLKDLSARLPYGVICTDSRHGDNRITEINIIDETVYCDNFDEYVKLDKIKPYLRPMSSMTEEEVIEFESITNELLENGASEEIWNIVMDWLNALQLDHRHLIEKGLALEAKEGMYK